MEQMLELARRMGFQNAVLVNTEDVPFEPSFRKYCEDNLCGNYNASWSCPPACGTPEEMKATVLAYPRALLLHTVWELDYRDGSAVKQAKNTHNRRMMDLMAELQNTRGFMIGSSVCGLCETCTVAEGKPCRLPEQMASCMSAYCIYVKKLTDACGLEYDSGEGMINFFGMYVFEEI